MRKSDLNAQLESLYCQHWQALKQLVQENDLSNPYLAWVHPDYETAKVRLVVVGKETNSWFDDLDISEIGSEQAVRALMRKYREFALGYDYSGKQSFWVPVQELYGRLNPDGRKYGFVALNVSKMDQSGLTPGDELRKEFVKTGILSDEIRILDRHLVVFFTGPDYEVWLDDWFPGLVRTGDKLKATLTAPSIRWPTFRTYHPRRLNYLSKRREVFDWIVDEFRSTRKISA